MQASSPSHFLKNKFKIFFFSFSYLSSSFGLFIASLSTAHFENFNFFINVVVATVVSNAITVLASGIFLTFFSGPAL